MESVQGASRTPVRPFESVDEPFTFAAFTENRSTPKRNASEIFNPIETSSDNG